MPERRSARSIELLVEALIRRLTKVVESEISARARVLTEEYLRSATAERRLAAPRAHVLEPPSRTEEPTAYAGEPSPKVPRPRRAQPIRPRRPRPDVVTDAQALPAVDPEQERRTAELAWVRAVLRPAAPVPPAPPVTAPKPARAAEDGGSLQTLEDHIRDQIPTLAGLSQSRYTARIAAWVGRVRLQQSGPEGERTRIASRILFDKLRNLAWSMEAHTIEALNLSWSTRNWERYIQENERIAATPDAPPPPKPEPETAVDVWSTPNEADTRS